MAKHGTVVAFSGAIGVGTKKLSHAVAKRLGWPWCSFGEYVRNYAIQHDRNPEDRAVLQNLGQALVLTNTTDFVRKVLAQAEWKPGQDLILDGLRHVEVRQALLQELGPETAFKLVHVTVDEDTRQERALELGIEKRMLSYYDQDLTEAQVMRIVPPYADVTVDGTLPDDIAVDLITSKLSLPVLEST